MNGGLTTDSIYGVFFLELCVCKLCMREKERQIPSVAVWMHGCMHERDAI